MLESWVSGLVAAKVGNATSATHSAGKDRISQIRNDQVLLVYVHDVRQLHALNLPAHKSAVQLHCWAASTCTCLANQLAATNDWSTGRQGIR
jgi:hypothetical protein